MLHSSHQSKKRSNSLILFFILFLGIGLLAYPSVSDYWNSFHQSQMILQYAEDIAQMNQEDYQAILESAHQYNQEYPLNWQLQDGQKERYNNELNVNEDGVMGYITIPKIDVKLSIFHGTDESVLQTSIGHLEGTSLPVGGEGTHSVLSGHRGLPSARLFSDLDKLREGDTFTVHILNETFTYEVDQIRVVEPSDLSTITVEAGGDYSTLVTCTPYAINTHRLLVRGRRIANADGNAKLTADAMQIKPLFIAPFIAIPIVLIMIGYLVWVTSPGHQVNRRRIYFEQMRRSISL